MDYLKLASEHNRVIKQFFASHQEVLSQCAAAMVGAFQNHQRILFCGNGGSACDAMHIAGEFVGRFKQERRGLPAIALSADSGIITAVANDYDFDRIFARQVEALGQTGDMLIALSTSGKSPNVLAAIDVAKEQKMQTILFTGKNGADKVSLVDRCFVIDSTDTAHIQECYMTALHALAEDVETRLLSS